MNGRIKRMTNPKFTSPAVSSFSVLSQSGSMWLALWSNLTLDYEAQSQYEMYITCTDTTSTGMVNIIYYSSFSSIARKIPVLKVLAFYGRL